MSETPEAPRRNFGFKPKEFERVNAPRHDADAPAEAPPLANDVFAIQRDLRAREIAAGMDELAPPERPKSGRRKRDYWTVLLAVNGLAALAALLSRGNVVVLVYAFSGAILLSIGATWIMWVLIDDY